MLLQALGLAVTDKPLVAADEKPCHPSLVLSRHTRRREIITTYLAIQGRACRRAPPSRP